MPLYIKKVLKQTPYKNDDLMMKRLYISCQLTLLSDLTIPNRLKNKIERYNKSGDEGKLLNIYRGNDSEVLLWHLPEHMTNYVRILVTKIKHIVTDEINQTRNYNDLSDEIIDNIMKTAYAQYDEGDEF